MKTVDILIPTYKPKNELQEMFKMIEKQTYQINQIIIINTEEINWKEFQYIIKDKYRKIKILVKHINKKSFDHGGTRDLGMRLSKADIVICMTQDAVPADELLVESLVKGLEYEKVLVAYGRQLPKSDCNETERYTRSFNYPKHSMIKSNKDIEKLGIKTYFSSNVCAAYKRKEYIELGGFIKQTIFNEDMIYGATIINAGYQIAYVAKANVYHSHNFSNKEQFQRNFDLGVSQADNPQVFVNIPVTTEGVKLVKSTMKYLYHRNKKRYILPMMITSGYKLIGYKLGKNYKKLPMKIIRKFTMNQGYWNNQDIKN